MGCKPFHDGLRYVQFGHNYLYLYVISPFPRAIHGTPITTFICAETHCSVSLSGLVHGCGQCAAGVVVSRLERALCLDFLEPTGDSVMMGNMWFNSICWAARGAEGVVIALDFSSTRWATFFALFLFCSFYYMSGWTLPANLYRGLILPLVHSVVPSLPPFCQFHAANYLQTR